MASLDSIINVQIDRQTTAPSRAGFGTALILGKSGKLLQKVQTFTDLTSVAAVFASTDPEYVMAQKYFGQTFKPLQLKIADWDDSNPLADELDAVEEFDADWYCLLIETAVQADILAAAAWIEAKRKIFIAKSSDAGCFDPAITTDVLSLLKAANYDRTATIVKKNGVTDYPDAAWAGALLPTDPGSVTWKFKTLAGVTVDVLTPNEKLAVLRNEAGTGKNGNTYTRVGGVNITEEGNMASGEFIDVMRGVDFIHARIQERIYFQLVNLPKVPYTNAGVNIVVNEINAVMQTAIAQGILRDDPAPTVTAPDVQDIDPIDRANRVLPDVKFEAQLAGAIHKVRILGVVTV